MIKSCCNSAFKRFQLPFLGLAVHVAYFSSEPDDGENLELSQRLMDALIEYFPDRGYALRKRIDIRIKRGLYQEAWNEATASLKRTDMDKRTLQLIRYYRRKIVCHFLGEDGADYTQLQSFLDRNHSRKHAPIYLASHLCFPVPTPRDLSSTHSEKTDMGMGPYYRLDPRLPAGKQLHLSSPNLGSARNDWRRTARPLPRIKPNTTPPLLPSTDNTSDNHPYQANFVCVCLLWSLPIRCVDV